MYKFQTNLVIENEHWIKSYEKMLLLLTDSFKSKEQDVNYFFNVLSCASGSLVPQKTWKGLIYNSCGQIACRILRTGIEKKKKKV